MVLIRTMIGIAALLALAWCGTKSSDDRESGASSGASLPSNWDGVSDYVNSSWEFIAP